jgi:two-component system KDP operon response regulator KdpE
LDGVQGGKLLVVVSEGSIRRSLHGTLYGLGFDIGEATSGREALAFSHIVKYDAVLLDMNMPGEEGFETCRQLRSLHPRITILILGDTEDHERTIEALEAGADDYMPKPFYMREVVARIRSALRRSRAVLAWTEEAITIGEIELIPAKRSITKSGAAISLTPKEFDLLFYLMSSAGLPIMHSKLLEDAWGTEHISSVPNLRTFIRQLRRKIEADPANPQYLLTDIRFGYRFVDPALAPGPTGTRH